jgi:AraC-like DNA-binding protein
MIARIDKRGIGCPIRCRSMRIEWRRHICDPLLEPAIAEHAWHVHAGDCGQSRKDTGRDGVDGVLLPKSSCFVPAGNPLTWRGSWGMPRMVILLEVDGFDVFCGPTDAAAFRESLPAYDPVIDHFIGLLSREMKAGAQPQQRFLEAFEIMLFSYTKYRHCRLAEEPSGRVDDMVSLRGFVDSHIGEPLTIEMMASAINCTTYHLAHMVKSNTGLTPYRYVLARRIERAKRLLCEGAMPLCDVALACGFSSQPHFTSMFGKATGMTPKQFCRQQESQRARNFAS